MRDSFCFFDIRGNKHTAIQEQMHTLAQARTRPFRQATHSVKLIWFDGCKGPFDTQGTNTQTHTHSTSFPHNMYLEHFPFCRCKKCRKEQLTFSIGIMTPTKPMGSLPQVVPSQMSWCHSRPGFALGLLTSKLYFKVDYFVKYSFRIAKRLTLNLTFIYIHVLGSKPNAVIKSEEECSHILVKTCLNCTHKKQQVYAGTFAQFMKHVTSHECDVQIIPKNLQIIVTSISYTVLSDNVHITDQVRGSSSIISGSVVTSSFSILNTTCYFYMLKVNLYKSIILQFNRSDLHFPPSTQVFDGPGTKCKTLTPRIGHLYQCSSFQCSVSSCCIASHVLSINYVEVRPAEKHFSRITVVQQGAFSLPISGVCDSTPMCLIWLETNNEFKLNLSVTNVEYVGDTNTRECHYAGVGFFEEMNNSLEAIDIFYVQQNFGWTKRYKTFGKSDLKRDHRDVQFIDPGGYYKIFITLLTEIQVASHTHPPATLTRNVFSRQNSVLLLWYSYPEYGSLSLQLYLSTTKCGVMTHNSSVCNTPNKDTRQVQLKFEKASVCTIHQFIIKTASLCEVKFSEVDIHPWKEIGNTTLTGTLGGMISNFICFWSPV